MRNFLKNIQFFKISPAAIHGVAKDPLKELGDPLFPGGLEDRGSPFPLEPEGWRIPPTLKFFFLTMGLVRIKKSNVKSHLSSPKIKIDEKKTRN